MKGEAVEVRIEDAIMKPLVSGADVKRFQEPRTATYLLFPYCVDADRARLFTPEEMAERFPLAWAYLRSFEAELRRRDSRKNDTDEKWFGYIYPKNLDKQEKVKLLVPRLVARLKAVADDHGRFYCDNVDVGGVIPRRADDVWLLTGVLNAPVSNLVFAWLSKAFRGDYRSANKQFIAPLPVPRASAADRAGLSALARGLQERRTAQVDDEARLAERLGAAARRDLPLERLLTGVRDAETIAGTMPRSVDRRDGQRWIDDERAADEEAALARIDALIRPDSLFVVTFDAGKLAFTIDEQEAARLFLTDAEAPLVEAQWRATAIAFAPTGKDDAKRLIARLRRVATEAEPALAAQIIEIGRALAVRDAVLRDDEAQLHELTSAMFGLTPAERRLVERGRV